MWSHLWCDILSVCVARTNVQCRVELLRILLAFYACRWLGLQGRVVYVAVRKCRQKQEILEISRWVVII